ncbi:MAG TPA: TRAP transporter small permease [Thermodesulfobacteriota bacterium]|nr:TRAP transporter small permease [Thermodesulfobacteriota bacterium]
MILTEKYLKFSIFCLMLLLVFWVSLQVFTRYVLNNPTSWSEEAANFTQVFLVFLGGTLAIFQKRTLRITFFVDRLPPRVVAAIELLMKTLILLFLVTMIWYSFFAISRLHNQITPGLRLPKSILFVSVPLGGILMLIATLREIRESYSKWVSAAKVNKAGDVSAESSQ